MTTARRRSTSPTTTRSSTPSRTSGSARCAARRPSTSTPSPTAPASTRSPATRTSARCTATSTMFSSEIGGTSLEDLDADQLEARKSMIDMDPPRHDELRGLIARRFTPRAVQVWEEAVRTVTDRVLDAALPKGEFDFVEEISSEIPMQVFAEILGVPQEDRRHIIELGDRLLGNQDPEYFVPPDPSHRLLPFSSPAARGDVRVRPQDGRRAAQAPRQRHRHPARVRAADASASSTSTSCCSPRRATRRRATRSRTACSACSSTPTRCSGCATTRSSSSRPPRRCCAGRRPCTTSGARRRARPSWRARRSPPARRSRPGSSRATATRTCSRRPTRSTSAARRTSTWPSGPAASTTAWARTSRAWRSGSRSRSCSSAWRTIELAGEPERLRSNFFNGIKRLPVRVTP